MEKKSFEDSDGSQFQFRACVSSVADSNDVNNSNNNNSNDFNGNRFDNDVNVASSTFESRTERKNMFFSQITKPNYFQGWPTKTESLASDQPVTSSASASVFAQKMVDTGLADFSTYRLVSHVRQLSLLIECLTIGLNLHLTYLKIMYSDVFNSILGKTNLN